MAVEARGDFHVASIRGTVRDLMGRPWRHLGDAEARTPHEATGGSCGWYRLAMKIRLSARVPFRGRIRTPIRHPTVGPIGAVERRTRIAIWTRWRADMSPYAPLSSTMANRPAVGVCHRNHRKAQGCARQKTGN